ncbi:MAG: hypothetical protein V3T31_06350, partial [candidate division Zixibacteria bacterium]
MSLPDNISIDFHSGSAPLIWLTLLLLVILTVYLYRRTNPPLRMPVKILLTGLRLIALLALGTALLEPVINYHQQYERPIRLSLLQDGSGSMGRVESGLSRQERLDSLTESPTFSRLADSSDISSYYFDDELSKERGESKGEATALGDALHEMARQQLDAPADFYLLLTDGRSNAGRDPADAAKELAAPVIVVDMAAGGSGFDISVDEISCNPVWFVGQPAEIVVRLSTIRGAGRQARIHLKQNGKVLAEEAFQIDSEAAFREVKLRYTPPRSGQLLLELAVPEQEGELTAENNQKTIAVKVLKSRVNLLLVTEHPDYEVGFLRRFLRSSDKYAHDMIVTGGNSGNLTGQFPGQQAELNKYDLIVLHDPDLQKLASYSSILNSYLADRGGAVWVMMGPTMAQSRSVPSLDSLLPFIPAYGNRVQYFDFQGEPAEGLLFHPALRLADDRATIRGRWAGQPPFKQLVLCGQIHPDAVLLAATSRSGTPERWPILGYRRIGPGKLMASAQAPFWPWKFMNLGLGDDASAYDRYMEGLISWLTVADDLKPVRIRPVKRVFTRGESIRFDGFASDLGFRPIPGVSGSVTLVHQDESASEFDRIESDLLEVSAGQYEAVVRALPPG